MWSRCSQSSQPVPVRCSPFWVGVDQAQQLLDFKEVLLVSLVEVIHQDCGEAKPLFGIQLATSVLKVQLVYHPCKVSA